MASHVIFHAAPVFTSSLTELNLIPKTKDGIASGGGPHTTMAFCVLNLVILIMDRGILKKVKQHWISWISWMRFLEVWLLFEVGGSQDQSHSPGKSRLHDGHHIRTPGDSSNVRIKLDEHGWKPLKHTTIYDIIIFNLYSDNLKAQRTKPGFTPLTENCGGL